MKYLKIIGNPSQAQHSCTPIERLVQKRCTSSVGGAPKAGGADL